jgi:hypothetical protein
MTDHDIRFKLHVTSRAFVKADKMVYIEMEESILKAPFNTFATS